jgi:serine/threonine protein kinase
VGVLAYVLLTGYSPFAGESKQETFCNISQNNLTFPEELFEGVSSCAQDFIRATLVVEQT